MRLDGAMRSTIEEVLSQPEDRRLDAETVPRPLVSLEERVVDVEQVDDV